MGSPCHKRSVNSVSKKNLKSANNVTEFSKTLLIGRNFGKYSCFTVFDGGVEL